MPGESLNIVLPSAADTDILGAALARSLPDLSQQHALLSLHGDLGAGKTALCRALLKALGVSGTIRSPTYTLMEPYELAKLTALHMDLYRLADPEELEWLGLRDMLAERALLLVEWPERGSGFLPAADLSIDIDYSGSGREVSLMPLTDAGQRLLALIKPAA